MTEVQFVTLLFTAPFLLLSAFWAIGLALLEWRERRNLRRIRNEIFK